MVAQAIDGAPQARFTQVQMPGLEQQHKAVLPTGQATDHHQERSYENQLQEKTSRPKTTLSSTRLLNNQLPMKGRG
jgi:hypothetical protein